MPESYPSSKPYVRWWWFSGKISRDVIDLQIDWCRTNNFGGVEIAWIYPLPNSEPGPKWLSEEWSEIVAYAKEHAMKAGLGCDLTFGTLWPFGGSIVEERDAAKTFAGISSQRLENSWEAAHTKPGYILNHLNRHALERYAEKMGTALARTLTGNPSALFCDSLELEVDRLWTDGFDEAFKQEFGYDIRIYMRDLSSRPTVRFDYRKLLSRMIIDEFYVPFTDICHNLGSISRVQCHGAPTDLLAAYANVDIPESEALLFDPQFSQIAASAAALSGKKIVSAETFSCLYGWQHWPGPGLMQKKEQTADLKLLADAMFANGINFIIWHGMPYNPTGGNNHFYATVHVGADSNFASEIPAFNQYLERVSQFMRQGKSHSDIAVYLPLEDAWMSHELPEELRRPSARYHWELHYQRLPETLAGFRPMWITNHFLGTAEFNDGTLRAGHMDFDALYLDCDWLDIDALKNIIRLAQQGLPVCINRKPCQPGFMKDKSYDDLIRRLFSQKSVSGIPQKTIRKMPLIESAFIPEFWCRELNGDLLIFFSHPMTKAIAYPLRYGQSFCETKMQIPIIINYAGKKTDFSLTFEPYQSVLMRLSSNGKIGLEDIFYKPQKPVVI